ncbi:MAG TPA: polyprenyl synthetase family protein [Gemmatimonadales bacterium]|jgi:geranylgeranyl pyrophosphate synthase|nr:polyprenyl synthetase family protein [Gemmatimonadales bacterium]
MSPAPPARDAASAEALLAEARELTDLRLDGLAGRLRRTHPGTDGEALAYALGTSGKRVRAGLVIAAYRAAGGSAPGVAGIAAAVEIVHTYSLVHDDLPCMDDDAQRRGRPTTHVRFDVPTATRAGFLLVPVAVDELASAAVELGLSAGALGGMAEVLLEASGIRGMVGGQWDDLLAEGRAPGLEELVGIHRRKTGALIEAACTLGGLAAGAGAGLLATLTAYGREIGLAFQIADDVLDATGTSEELGKTAGRDATLAKATYVSVLGVDAARREALRHAGAACEALRAGGTASGALESLAGYIVKRRS